MLVNDTPIETYYVHGIPVLVKREDLCCPFPGPSFSKMRGVYAHMRSRPEQVIGVLDTFHSKAGWAVSYCARELGKQVVNFWPRFKADPAEGLARDQQRYAEALGATLVDLPAGRSSVLYHQAKKLLNGSPDSYMMPNALKLPESVAENAAEATRSAALLPAEGTLVISISSGTVASGVVRGLALAKVLKNYMVKFHMGYSRPPLAAENYILESSQIRAGEVPEHQWQFIDEGYGYKDAAPAMDYPFPCNPHYDAKAWHWLSQLENLKTLKTPIVFWNIGD